MGKITKNVVIVGGGTAGWITAGVLASHFKNEDDHGIKITLIESPDIPTVGVGEGTWPSMRVTLQRMGVSETEFMRECDVSLKQGSRFENWVTGDNDYYYHPFTMPQGFGDINLARHWQRVRDQVSFTDAVCPQGKLCDQGLAAKQITTPEYAFQVNYGYHLNAGKFADFLKKHCTEKLGVHFISDNVQQVIAAPNDDIDAVTTEHHGPIYGDLFIDCTGFTGLLIDKHYGIEFNSVRDVLFNDCALATQVDYNSPDDPIASHTLSTAQSSGWIWNIGLPTRRGIGHVYASDFTTDEQAERELRDYLANIIGRSKAEEVNVRQLRFSPGYRQKFWHRNCVAIGLSAGFVEPLEASALALIEFSGRLIIDQFPSNREIMDITAKRFNQKFSYHWQRVIEFLKLHYVLNQNNDDGYWMAHRHRDSLPESLRDSLNLWRHQPPWISDAPQYDELFPSASYQFVIYGMGFITQDPPAQTRKHDQEVAEANQLFQQNIQRTQQLLNALPKNRELLNKVRTHGFQKL